MCQEAGCCRAALLQAFRQWRDNRRLVDFGAIDKAGFKPSLASALTASTARRPRRPPGLGMRTPVSCSSVWGARNRCPLSGLRGDKCRSGAAKENHRERSNPTKTEQCGCGNAEKIKQRIDQQQPTDGSGEGENEKFVYRVPKETGGHQKSGSGPQHEAAEDRGEAAISSEQN
jgi:hypothetical protein